MGEGKLCDPLSLVTGVHSGPGVHSTKRDELHGLSISPPE